jgi:hypothetical protein
LERLNREIDKLLSFHGFSILLKADLKSKNAKLPTYSVVLIKGIRYLLEVLCNTIYDKQFMMKLIERTLKNPALA